MSYKFEERSETVVVRHSGLASNTFHGSHEDCRATVCFKPQIQRYVAIFTGQYNVLNVLNDGPLENYSIFSIDADCENATVCIGDSPGKDVEIIIGYHVKNLKIFVTDVNVTLTFSAFAIVDNVQVRQRRGKMTINNFGTVKNTRQI